MNIILVIADTFRRDHLPCYGNKQIQTPNLDRFAEQSLIFEDCFASSFPTVPARADILTGRYTFTYLNWGPLTQDEITLPQILCENGYLTVGAADTPFLLRNGCGYDHGFDDLFWIRGQRSGPEHEDVVKLRRAEEDYFAPKTFKTAIAWLDRTHARPFFLYIDTWDPHEPWDPPIDYVRRYMPDYDGRLVEPCYWSWKEAGYNEQDLQTAHACYCGEISMVDRWFGRLLEKLEELDLVEDTAVLFTSDHGFYFGEHGFFGKRRFRWPDDLSFEEGFKRGLTLNHGSIYRSPLYRELTQVPLLMKLPGHDSSRVSGLVALPDLMPTILDLAEIDTPSSIRARSVLPLVNGSAEALREILVTSTPLEELGDMTLTVDDQQRKTLELSPSTISDGKWELLYAAEGEPVELYAQSDLKQEHNLAAEVPEVAARLHEQFVEFLEEQDTPEESLSIRRNL